MQKDFKIKKKDIKKNGHFIKEANEKNKSA